jgi:hypothetical protein
MAELTGLYRDDAQERDRGWARCPSQQQCADQGGRIVAARAARAAS